MRKNLYLFLIIGTVTLLAGIIFFSKKPAASAEKKLTYKTRVGKIALAGEWLNTKAAIEGLIANIEQNPQDYKSMLALVQAYIQEGRTTGDHAFYDKEALELVDKVVKAEPNNYEALCCKATILLSQHHFAEGLAVAKIAQPIDSNSAFIWGILCDANLELGNYDEAVKMADKMISIRPDIRSYARVSYLREIYGDLNGAKEAAKLAVSAGYPGLEQTEWTRCILAHLHHITGSLDSAEYQYKMALAERPDYAFAIAGLGKLEKAKGNYKAAIAQYERAKSLITEYSFSDELTDLYRLNNEPKKADNNAEEVIDMLSPNAGEDVESKSGHGHYADKELAYAYLKINEVDDALKHADIEYKRRPNNIDVCETIAWVQYKKGNYSQAEALITKALKTNCKNPDLLCRAGLIKVKANKQPEGMQFITAALKTNPFLELELKKEAQAYLSSSHE
jgi:tetratricopeptide (TPR) repeat protein